jgi:hypothetical protein
MMSSESELTAREHGHDVVDEDLLDAVRRHLDSLQDARLIRNLSAVERREYEDLLRLERHLLGRRTPDNEQERLLE